MKQFFMGKGGGTHYQPLLHVMQIFLDFDGSHTAGAG